MIRPDQKDLIDAAIKWWHTKRPANFTEEKHLMQPTVKVTTETEKQLCHAVANHLRHEEAMR